ncbi:hypothetical protein PAMA_007371 [Pampus argenteus]
MSVNRYGAASLTVSRNRSEINTVRLTYKETDSDLHLNRDWFGPPLNTLTREKGRPAPLDDVSYCGGKLFRRKEANKRTDSEITPFLGYSRKFAEGRRVLGLSSNGKQDVISGEMDCDHLELNPRILAAVRRTKVKSVQDVLSASGPDLQRLTGLSHSDIQQLILAAAAACRRSQPIPALLLLNGECRRFQSRLSVGCPVLDQLLRGGLPVGGVTELSGESRAGKTQLALQLCLSVQYPPHHGGLGSGAVYICTEDRFPSRRLQQLIEQQTCLRSDVPSAEISGLQFSDHVYIEHIADLGSLHTCLSRRVPLLLARGLVRLVVVDSVASLFRSEFQAADWLERTRQLLTFSSCLHHLSHEFNTPVLCINQVTHTHLSSLLTTR